MKKTHLYLVANRDELDAALQKGVTFTTLATHAAKGAASGASSWAEVCRYGSECPEKLELVAAAIAATESESARASLYAGARRAIKQHPEAVAIIAKRKTDTGADGFTVREFDAAAAAAAANAATDKREATKAAKDAADAAAAAIAADNVAFVADVLRILGVGDRSVALDMLRALTTPAAATDTAAAAAA